MSDQTPTSEYDDIRHHRNDPAANRHRYVPAGDGSTSDSPPAGGYPPARPSSYADARRPSWGRGPFTAAVLAAALVAGGVSGVAGAAGFAVLGPSNEAASAATTTEATGSGVVAVEDSPAEPGSVEDVASSVLPAVVQINVRGARGQGSGSGLVLSQDGEILTNNHVVQAAAEGGTLSVGFNDGSTARAEILGTDPLTDLAVIKARNVSGLPVAQLGRSDDLDVGEEVVAIGSPFGLAATVTSGIVSALNRPVSVEASGADATATTYPAIQTDAAINPGNSGGPLVNMQGDIVGVNSSIRTTPSSMGAGGSIGLGFAIPLDEVLPIVQQLRTGEVPTHARLGVAVQDVSDTSGLASGARLDSVSDGSAADEAGLRPGDVVTKVEDDLVTGATSLVATVRGYRPGEPVTLTVVRDGEEQTVEVTLDSDEGSPAS